MYRKLNVLTALCSAGVLACALVGDTTEPTEPVQEPAPPRVAVGLERPEEFRPLLAGKRLGLVVHGASQTWDGRHAIEVLRDAGLDVVRLFSPEHGLRGQAAAGEEVASGLDLESGLPVVSLYGAVRQPQPAELADLEVLVFDLQGAGVRFYTYVSTLILCLEAAAENDLEFVVLDRPNPLGGMRVEGPVAAPREQVPASFVNLAPGPLVHGLTLGEMARQVNSTRQQPARLTVVKMAGWQRTMTWNDTGRPWVPPSPNLRTAEAALAYPGIALFEATNVSEGRGTETPFLLLGAPWFEPGPKVQVRQGFELRPARFVPYPSPAAPKPKFLNQQCAGWRLSRIHPETARPYALGLELVAQLAAEPEFEWRRQGAALTWLLGTPRIYEMLAEGRPTREILAQDHADQIAWREKSRDARLY